MIAHFTAIISDDAVRKDFAPKQNASNSPFNSTREEYITQRAPEVLAVIAQKRPIRPGTLRV